LTKQREMRKNVKYGQCLAYNSEKKVTLFVKSFS